MTKRRILVAVGTITLAVFCTQEGHAQSPAQASGSWYYCDPAHAYYPYASTCAVPWREVAPASPSPPVKHAVPPIKKESEAEVRAKPLSQQNEPYESTLRAFKNAHWRIVETDNGAVYKIDISPQTMFREGVGVWAMVYEERGAGFDPGLLHSYFFNCRHGYMTSMMGEMAYLPPRSVGAKLAAIACANAK